MENMNAFAYTRRLFSVKMPFSYQEKSFFFQRNLARYFFVFAENLSIYRNLPQLMNSAIQNPVEQHFLKNLSLSYFSLSWLRAPIYILFYRNIYICVVAQAHISIQCSEIYNHYFISTFFFLPQWFRMATKNTRINYVYKIFLLINILAVRRA